MSQDHSTAINLVETGSHSIVVAAAAKGSVSAHRTRKPSTDSGRFIPSETAGQPGWQGVHVVGPHRAGGAAPGGGGEDVAVGETEVAPDTRVLTAFVVGTAEEAPLRAQAEAALAPYKCPRRYIYRDALPRSANGKLLRRALAQA